MVGDDESSPPSRCRSDFADEAMDRAIKDLQTWRLLRLAVLVVGSGLGIGCLYAVRGTEVHRYWWGSALALTGAVLGATASLAQRRAISRPGAPTMRHYPWLLLAAGLVVAGVLLPLSSLH